MMSMTSALFAPVYFSLTMSTALAPLLATLGFGAAFCFGSSVSSSSVASKRNHPKAVGLVTSKSSHSLFARVSFETFSNIAT
ncbi:hypothetical protein D3C81_1748730 [compost metagenome]